MPYCVLLMCICVLVYVSACARAIVIIHIKYFLAEWNILLHHSIGQTRIKKDHTICVVWYFRSFNSRQQKKVNHNFVLICTTFSINFWIEILRQKKNLIHSFFCFQNHAYTHAAAESFKNEIHSKKLFAIIKKKVSATAATIKNAIFGAIFQRFFFILEIFYKKSKTKQEK